MTKKAVCYFVAFFLSFASIAYELILAQSLAAFLENSILRYSVTIGLYMCSLGLGSLLAGEKWTKNAVINLLFVEILLTVLGGFSVVILFWADGLDFGRVFFNVVSHSLIILIGILSGFEIPLLVRISERFENFSINKILSVNYAGAFVGTVAFAFIFYPKAGLLLSAFLIGIFNAISGLFLFFLEEQVEVMLRKQFYCFLYLLAFLFLILSFCVIFADQINLYFMNIYLSK